MVDVILGLQWGDEGKGKIVDYFAKNYDVIRYDDVLLMQAEAYIELSQQDKALPIINQIRARAAASTGRLKKIDGTFQ